MGLSVCFIDLAEPDQRAHNRGDYKVGSVARKNYSSGRGYSCGRESIVVHPGLPFIDK
jgi:hypothetical protein